MFNSKYAETLNLHRQAKDGHIQKLIKGGRSLTCNFKKLDSQAIDVQYIISIELCLYFLG